MKATCLKSYRMPAKSLLHAAQRALATAFRPAIAGLIAFCAWQGGWIGAQQGANSPEPHDPQAVQIYQQKCAHCHGAEGEGTADYPKPLAGTKSLDELVRFIDEMMPEDDPESCVGQEAERVARYIYDAFYSPIAQARRAPPRIALSRLTANQLRQVLADLVCGWAAAPAWDDQRGLEAEYYDGRSFRRDKRQIQRRDPLIDFHFGNESPAPGSIGSEEFAIRWQGGLYVPQTGEYQIAIESDNGVRLWLNDMNAPLIDRWVRSGDERLHRATLFLLGGRVYPLRLEFMKFKEKTASVRLLWRMPHRVLEPIPNRYLSPHRYQPVFVATTPFPPEDRSQGYTRGSSVSLEWQQALVDVALQTASFVAENADRLAGTRPDAGDRAERLKEYCRLLAERAFRRPLNAQEQERFVDRPFQLHASPVDAAKQSVLAVLLSPQFVYVNLPWGDSSIEPYARAAQLSLALWDSLPDEPLWRAAREGKTMDAGELRRQAERMVRDLRARAKLGGFVEQWLKLDQMHDVVKDPQLYPGFTPELVSDLRASLDLFLDDVLWGANADWRRLLLADYVYANARMAEFYGWQLPETPGDTQPFVKVVLERDRYAGLLTHPLLMSGFAYTSTSSPIHRGVFVARSLLGKFLRPPPEAVAPLAPDLHPELTTRARVELQTSPTQCQTCHAMINSLGFLLENYDAVGRYRLLEKNRPIDASGRYRQPDGTDVALQGARALAEYLASSDESARAFVLQLFQHALGQPLAAYGSNTLNELTARFREQGYSVPDLLVEIACRAASLPVATNPALSVAPLPTTTPH